MSVTWPGNYEMKKETRRAREGGKNHEKSKNEGRVSTVKDIRKVNEKCSERKLLSLRGS